MNREPIEIEGFRRPLSSCILEDGTIISLTENHNEVIYFLQNKSSNYTLSYKFLGIKNPKCIASNQKNEFVIYDSFDGFLHLYNSSCQRIKKYQLKKSNDVSIKYDNSSDSFLILLANFSIIYQIEKLSKEPKLFFDLSELDKNNYLASFALHNNLLFLLHGSNVTKVDLKSDSRRLEVFLSFGRGGNGLVRSPSDINVVGDEIFINDNKNYLIQVYNFDMNFLYQVGSKGNSLGAFDLPVSSFCNKKYLFINDKNNDRIISFSVKSREFNAIVKDKFTQGELRRPSGMDTDAYGNLYVSDRSNGVIQIFDSQLCFIKLLDLGRIKLNRPASVVVLENNTGRFIAILERKTNLKSEVNIYQLSKDGFSIKNGNSTTFDHLNDSQDMIKAPDQSIFIADTLNRRIINIDINGSIKNEVSLAKISGNLRILIKTIFVRDDGCVYTADFDECIIYKFDKNLNYLESIDYSSYKKQFIVLRAIYVSMDKIYLCVRGQNQLCVGDFSGNVKQRISIQKLTGFSWNHPVKICKNINGDIVVADKENDRLVLLNE